MTIDAAAYVGEWPFRALEGTVADLATTMRGNRVRRAVVSPIEGLFYTDPRPANERLLRRLARRRNLWAAPIVSLRMADWREQFATLADKRRVRAARLAPAFHGYRAAQAGEAADLAAELGLTLAVQIRIEDERRHPPFVKMRDVPLEDVVALAAAAPSTRVVASAVRLREMLDSAQHIRQLKNLWLDMSHLDGLCCLKEARDAVGARRLMFSTCWPFFYARSAVLKVAEAEMPAREKDAVMGGNAERAFGLA